MLVRQSAEIRYSYFKYEYPIRANPPLSHFLITALPIIILSLAAPFSPLLLPLRLLLYKYPIIQLHLSAPSQATPRRPLLLLQAEPMLATAYSTLSPGSKSALKKLIQSIDAPTPTNGNSPPPSIATALPFIFRTEDEKADSLFNLYDIHPILPSIYVTFHSLSSLLTLPNACTPQTPRSRENRCYILS